MITVDFRRLNIRPGFKILDIGSGPGRHTCAASQFKDVTAIGADLSFDDITEAKRRLEAYEYMGECRGRWGVLSTNILKLPFGDETFDLVICAEVLEHIPDHQAAMLEIVRVLKPAGDLVVSVPRYLPERVCWRLSDDYTNANMGHVRIYKKAKLATLLEKTDVKLWAHHHAHSLHSPFWWLKCLMGPTRTDSWAVNLYHRFLVWDLMKKPVLTRRLEGLLNPLLGKSLVLYLRKGI
ncbi:MAG: class I SAM-dependent methyltransferase [Deltaproteobacteria bacterium]|nr:class I SAM-dependent methyltransferase [Deltaproteobacteria bacterium]